MLTPFVQGGSESKHADSSLVVGIELRKEEVLIRNCDGCGRTVDDAPHEVCQQIALFGRERCGFQQQLKGSLER